MYFVISVLPISMTSGTLLPAIVASNFVRCWFQVWYSTLTFTPGCDRSKAWVAALTTPGQLSRASSCSQTVRVVAVAELGFVLAVVPVAVAALSARQVQITTAAMKRTFIEASSQRRRHAGRSFSTRAGPKLVNTTTPR
jgi:hypothetical protein